MLDLTLNAEPIAPLRDADVSLTGTPSTERAAVVSGRAANSIDIETLYLQHRTLLMSVACRKFRVPDGDAEALLQEVFLSFIQTGTRIDNVRAWLVAATCNASRHYWRLQGRAEPLPEDYLEYSDPRSEALPERRANEITLQQALGYLQPRCRETLRLHYFEGRSASEVAQELDTTVRYAEKLIHNCLKRVREIYMNITKVNR